LRWLGTIVLRKPGYSKNCLKFFALTFSDMEQFDSCRRHAKITDLATLYPIESPNHFLGNQILFMTSASILIESVGTDYAVD